MDFLLILSQLLLVFAFTLTFFSLILLEIRDVSVLTRLFANQAKIYCEILLHLYIPEVGNTCFEIIVT